MSSFLFTLVVDVLSHLISRAVASRLIRGVKVGSEGIVVSHLQFADDKILFLENDKYNFLNTFFIFQIFELSSGLKLICPKAA